MVLLLAGVVVALGAGLLLGLLDGGGTSGEERALLDSASTGDPAGDLSRVDDADLPAEAHETLALIDAGGPCPSPDRHGRRGGVLLDLRPPRVVREDREMRTS